MFFKDIHKWSKKVMWGVTIGCYALYFCIVVLAPTIVVCCQYNLFGSNDDGGTFKKVTGFALIVIVICGIMSYSFIKKSLAKLPNKSIAEQRLRFSLEMLFDLIPIGIALFTLLSIRDDVDLAFNTIIICLWIFLGGILFNGLVIKYLDAEWEIRQATKLDKEKEKRRDVV